MKYTFDDQSFGRSEDGSRRKVDVALVARPRCMTLPQWYAFAAKLARAMNKECAVCV